MSPLPQAIPLTRGLIFDIKRFSIHDGPGIRTTVFLKGCPLDCWWCHNPESQAPGPEIMVMDNRCIRCGACLEVCEQGAISQDGDLLTTDSQKCTLCGACVEACYAEAREMVGREMTVAPVVAEIERDVPNDDESGGGVPLSGGEPLMQPGFLLAVLRACKEREIHTALDTCGYVTWEALDRIRAQVDLFLYDLKLMDEKKHRQFTGVSNEAILQNLQSLSQRGHDIVVRVPVIPGINDDDENIGRIGAFAAGLPSLNRVDLLPYHPSAVDKYERLDKVYGLRDVRPPSEEKLARIGHILRGFGLQVKVGG